MKKLLLTFLSISSATLLNAQIALDNYDLAAPGDTVFLINDQSPVPAIGPGNAGANQFYDFEFLNAGTVDTLLFVAPSATPYASSYPAATVALKYTDIDVFFKNDAGGAYIEGQAGTFMGYSGVVLKNNPVEKMFEFPMAYNTTFNDVSRMKYDMDTVINLGFTTADSVRIKRTKDKTVTCDGWGSIKTPTDSFACIRIHETGTIVDSVFLHTPFGWQFAPITGNPQTTQVDHYSYWTKAMKFALVEFDYDGGTSTVSNVTYQQTPAGASSIAEVQSFVKGMYPNPASDRLTFEFETSEQKTILIYNSLGELVKKEVLDGNVSSFTVSDLPSGIYTGTVTSAKGNSHVKFTVAR